MFSRLGRPVIAALALLLLPLDGIAQTPATAGFQTKARQIYMIEAATGTVLLAQNENEPIAPASLAKLMTMEVVFDAIAKGEISSDTQFPVSEYAWRTGGAPSRTATMFAALKSSIPVVDLIKGVVVQNANDACIVLAEGMAGSDEAFGSRMTRRALELGMTQSLFVNSTGLPDAANRTTVRDLVTLSKHLQQTYPQFYPLYVQPEFLWNKITQRNRNPLLSLNIGVDGLATGFAEGQGFSIATSINRDGKRFFLAMGGLSSDKERLEESRRVLEWALASFENRRLFAAGEVVGEASVYGGSGSSVGLLAREPIDVFVPANNPERLSARIAYRWPLTAPVAAGDQAGTLIIFSGEKMLREVPLFTAAAVDQGGLPSRALDALTELMLFWL
jgi:D-alanyl-D-alanine carboxypeptidase (penicillin-binding protein 5/6)